MTASPRGLVADTPTAPGASSRPSDRLDDRESSQRSSRSLGIRALVCRECGREYPVEPAYSCEFCFGPLEVSYDPDEVASRTSKEAIESGPLSLWRYRSLLPDPDYRIDTGTGFTPLRDAPRLAAELGLKKLWLKNDAQNPTHSFKDRVVSVALSVAKDFGFEVAACASTGNLANAVAAHAAASGMKSVVFIPRGLEPAKVAATAIYGGTVVEIEGSYDDVNRVCGQLAITKPWAFVNVNLRPFYAQGSKTLGFEVAEQLGWRTPDAVVVPVASGALLTKISLGFDQLRSIGLIGPGATKVCGAQAEGCSPVARAYADGADHVKPVKPDTIAKSLGIGDPADGHYALDLVRSSGGALASVPESKIADGISLLARTEGIFTETAGGVTISALEELARTGAIDPDEETVAFITGTGLKTLEALEPPRTVTVAADVDRVHEALEREGL
ncbi:MAG TPA: threonine synthase [Actinomycetota bacterium]|nr:threonine synthase [Actinomycetota bacterium]